ncbi:putative chromatin regulator PHD family [Dioscorea sansibarensis]
MGTGWRRAFCTSARRESPAEKQQVSPSPSPRSCSKLGGLFSSASNPSTPRLMQQPELVVSTPTLRCRTRSPPPPPPPAASVDEPKLQCKTKLNPSTPPASSTRLSSASPNPSSPISPSRFALFKASLRLSRCGVCARSVKRGQGTAVFTAECSHSFHFPCISSHIRNHGCLVCPVCSATWRQAPFLSSLPQMNNSSAPEPEQGNAEHGRRNREDKACSVEAPKPKLYDDDEPLLLSSSGGCAGGGGAAAGGSRFVPIPEADDEDEDGEFQGFSVTPTSTSPRSPHRACCCCWYCGWCRCECGASGRASGERSEPPELCGCAQGESTTDDGIDIVGVLPQPVTASTPRPGRRAGCE